jgi:hypothetical protein
MTGDNWVCLQKMDMAEPAAGKKEGAQARSLAVPGAVLVSFLW